MVIGGWISYGESVTVYGCGVLHYYPKKVINKWGKIVFY